MEQDIYEELKSIKQYLLLGAKSALNMDDAALLTGLSKSRLYCLVSKKQVPHYKKGKSTYFNKKELENWMLQIRVSTDEEVKQQAAQYVYNKNWVYLLCEICVAKGLLDTFCYSFVTWFPQI